MGWFEPKSEKEAFDLGEIVGGLRSKDTEQDDAIAGLRRELHAYQEQNAPTIAWAEEQRTRRSRVRGFFGGIFTGVRSRVAVAIYGAAATYLIGQFVQHVRLPHIHL